MVKLWWEILVNRQIRIYAVLQIVHQKISMRIWIGTVMMYFSLMPKEQLLRQSSLSIFAGTITCNECLHNY